MKHPGGKKLSPCAQADSETGIVYPGSFIHQKGKGEKTMQDLLNRITFNQEVLCGKPLIRGLRISVEMILELLARGAAEEEILQDYPLLELDDLRAALLYAHHMVARENVFDRVAAG
jgi:uncharacterized protein (DUF433 family)